MADRRQGDRRENSSFASKKVSISLSTFISIIAFTIIIITSIILCRILFVKGYDNGYRDGYSDALLDTDYIFEYDEEHVD